MTEHRDTEHLAQTDPAIGWSARQLMQLACRLAEQDLADLGKDK